MDVKWEKAAREARELYVRVKLIKTVRAGGSDAVPAWEKLKPLLSRRVVECNPVGSRYATELIAELEKIMKKHVKTEALDKTRDSREQVARSQLAKTVREKGSDAEAAWKELEPQLIERCNSSSGKVVSHSKNLLAELRTVMKSMNYDRLANTVRTGGPDSSAAWIELEPLLRAQVGPRLQSRDATILLSTLSKIVYRRERTSASAATTTTTPIDRKREALLSTQQRATAVTPSNISQQAIDRLTETIRNQGSGAVAAFQQLEPVLLERVRTGKLQGARIAAMLLAELAPFMSNEEDETIATQRITYICECLTTRFKKTTRQVENSDDDDDDEVIEEDDEEFDNGSDADGGGGDGDEMTGDLIADALEAEAARCEEAAAKVKAVAPVEPVTTKSKTTATTKTALTTTTAAAAAATGTAIKKKRARGHGDESGDDGGVQHTTKKSQPASASNASTQVADVSTTTPSTATSISTSTSTPTSVVVTTSTTSTTIPVPSISPLAAFETTRLQTYSRLLIGKILSSEQFTKSVIGLIHDAIATSDTNLEHIAAAVIACASDFIEKGLIDYNCYEQMDRAAGSARRIGTGARASA